MVLRVNPLSMFAGKLKERPTITCPVCGAVHENHPDEDTGTIDQADHLPYIIENGEIVM